MTIKAQWQARQMGLYVLSQAVSITNVLLLVIGIRFYKLAVYGLGAMPQYRWPKAPTLELVMETFIKSSVYPILIWVPVAIIIDAYLRRPILK